MLASSGLLDFATAILPFVLLMAFWIVLRTRVQKGGANPVVEKLEEIRGEIHALREAIERQQDPYGGR